MADIIYLVRHAAPPAEKHGRYWGHADPGVDLAALAGIASLADLAWRPPSRLLTSPLARAGLTAAELAPRFGLIPETDAELAEADFGEFDGLTFGEIEARYPEAAREWGEQLDAFAFPGGESVPAFLERAERAWRRCIELPDAVVAVVTHGGIISAWTSLFLEVPPERRFIFRPLHGSLTAFTRKKDAAGWELTCFNNRP